ncbi:hypothetical protein CMI46_00680 [Candidatus Pacearchaeota archaeon]|nr:hypothetical protein [Candidatus Pacearchaeota archaeon]
MSSVRTFAVFVSKNFKASVVFPAPGGSRMIVALLFFSSARQWILLKLFLSNFSPRSDSKDR